MKPLIAYYQDGPGIVFTHISPIETADWQERTRQRVFVEEMAGVPIHPLDIKVGDTLNHIPVKTGAFKVLAIRETEKRGKYHLSGHVTLEYEGGFKTFYYDGDESIHPIYIIS